MTTSNIGLLFEDNFNQPGATLDSSKWMNNALSPVDPSRVKLKEITVNPLSKLEKALTLRRRNDYLISKKGFSPELEFDNFFHISFDYFDLSLLKDNTRHVKAGFVASPTTSSLTQTALSTVTSHTSHSYFRNVKR